MTTHQEKNAARAPVYIRWGLIAITAAVALLAPLFLQNYWLHVVIIAYYFALLASSWALLAGVAGQFSFGHLAFVAIGGYTSGLLGRYLDTPPAIGIIAGILMAGLSGLVIALLVLRFKAAYLALFTIAFSEILRIIIKGEATITRGDQGLAVAPLLGEDIISRVPYYYIMLGVLVVSLMFMYWLVNSRIGLFLRAIREDETAASARGVDVVRYKILAFVITSMLAGLAGVFFAHYVNILSPNMLVLPQMGLVIAMAIIGGVESLLAAALGGIIIQISLEWLRDFDTWRLVIFGLLLMLTLRFARNGLLAPLLQWLSGSAPRAEFREDASQEGIRADGQEVEA